MNSSPRVPIRLGAGLLTAFFIAVALLLLAPATPAHAEGDPPQVGVLTQTVNLATTDASISVEVVITPNGQSVSSVTFVLDYDEDCVRIDSTSSDVDVVPSGYASEFVNDPDNGELEVAIWDPDGTQSAFSTGDLLAIGFGLEDACRTATEHTAVFSFASATPAFGKADGTGSLAGEGIQGTYTLNMNEAPDITSNAFNAAELVSGDRSLGALTATDEDNDTVTFSLATNCEESFNNDGFSIASGALRTSRTFNFEGVKTYPVCVQANDGRGGITSELVVVTVTDANDNPTDIALSVSTVPEGATAGTTIGAFTTTDEDNYNPGSSDEDFRTYTYTISETAGTDYDSFQISGNDLQVKAGADFDYYEQAIYKVRIRSTDGGDLFVERLFTIQVLGKSLLILPGEPDVPYIVGANAISVPIKYEARGNEVGSAAFEVSYDSTCVNYAGANGFNGLQSGFNHVGDPDSDDTTPVVISIASSTTILREGIIGYLTFTGDETCANPTAWITLSFNTPTLEDANDDPVQVDDPTDGKLIVMPNDTRGDCNSSGSLEAGDFSAIAIDVFDVENESWAEGELAQNSWLWTPEGDYAGSAQGCDANADRTLAVADITCAARLFFNLSCTLGRDGRTQAAQIAAPASVAAAPGSTVAAPIVLTANGNAVAAAAFTMQIDPALVFDPADADADGVPDAVSFNTPAGFFKMVLYDAPTRRLQVLVAGLVMPLPVLPDGAFATVHLQGAASATGGAAPINLNDVSLGSVEGNEVEVIVAPIGMLNRVFLPAVER
jgi:hypothetical protein